MNKKLISDSHRIYNLNNSNNNNQASKTIDLVVLVASPRNLTALMINKNNNSSSNNSKNNKDNFSSNNNSNNNSVKSILSRMFSFRMLISNNKPCWLLSCRHLRWQLRHREIQVCRCSSSRRISVAKWAIKATIKITRMTTAAIIIIAEMIDEVIINPPRHRRRTDDVAPTRVVTINRPFLAMTQNERDFK